MNQESNPSLLELWIWATVILHCSYCWFIEISMSDESHHNTKSCVKYLEKDLYSYKKDRAPHKTIFSKCECWIRKERSYPFKTFFLLCSLMAAGLFFLVMVITHSPDRSSIDAFSCSSSRCQPLQEKKNYMCHCPPWSDLKVCKRFQVLSADIRC